MLQNWNLPLLMVITLGMGLKRLKIIFNWTKLLNDDQRLYFTSIYFIGKAETWFNSYVLPQVNVELEDFKLDMCARFKEALDGNIVEEFNELEQKCTIEDYLDSFEALRSLMKQRNPLLPESYFLDSFMIRVES